MSQRENIGHELIATDTVEYHLKSRRYFMATKKKAGADEAEKGLRLVVVGRGETRGRRPHLLRLRESLYQELKEVADGQTYLLIEIAMRRLIDDLKSRPVNPVEIIQAQDLDATQLDEHLLDQFSSPAAAASRRAPSRVTKKDQA